MIRISVVLKVFAQTVFMGMPAILVALGDSLVWNLISWTVWVAWMLWLVLREPNTSSRAGSFLFLVFAVAGYEFNVLRGHWYGYVMALVALWTLPTTYLEKCKSLGLNK